MTDVDKTCVAVSLYHLDSTALGALGDKDTFIILDPGGTAVCLYLSLFLSLRVSVCVCVLIHASVFHVLLASACCCLLQSPKTSHTGWRQRCSTAPSKSAIPRTLL